MVIRKTFRVESAHRLKYSYTKRCHGLHGHSYVFDIYLNGGTQDKAQMLMDFSLLSDKIKGFLDGFDHSILVWKEDKTLLELAPKLNDRFIILPYNTTAEQISRHIYAQAEKMELPIYKVRVSETVTACAEYKGEDEISIDLDDVVFSPAIQITWK